MARHRRPQMTASLVNEQAMIGAGLVLESEPNVESPEIILRPPVRASTHFLQQFLGSFSHKTLLLPLYFDNREGDLL